MASFFSSCAANDSLIVDYLKEEINPNLEIHQGLLSQKKQTIGILREGKIVAIVIISEPKIVVQANKKEPWGYYQFPGIYPNENGNIIVSWQMIEDSHLSYGKGGNCKLMSRDEGMTFESLDHNYFPRVVKSIDLSNGEILQTSPPASKLVSSFLKFPNYIIEDTILKRRYYLESELPSQLRGVYFTMYDKKNHISTRIHGELEDPGFLRYSIDGSMPIEMQGNIRELKSGELVSGMYPGYYQTTDGKELVKGITFYKSNDKGYHWKVIGKIPYEIKEIDDRTRFYDNVKGFSEASFEILKDSSFFCVMRTGRNTPMYKTYSVDNGAHWSKPEAFTPNGVYPQTFQLENGVMVLSSGRPGVQLRFNLNGDGKIWTEPIDMVRFVNLKGNVDIWASCGYTCLMKGNSNTFYMVYSDFKCKNERGQARKTIFFRKIEVIKQ